VLECFKQSKGIYPSWLTLVVFKKLNTKKNCGIHSLLKFCRKLTSNQQEIKTQVLTENRVC